jgi:excisionase family DNA binding protein
MAESDGLKFLNDHSSGRLDELSVVMPHIEFSNLSAVYRRIDELAHDVADTPRGSPRRLKMIEEMDRLNIFAEFIATTSRKIPGRSSSARKVHHTHNILTTNDVAQLFQLNPKTIERLARKGSIPGRRVRKKWRFNRQKLLAYLLKRGSS